MTKANLNITTQKFIDSMPKDGKAITEMKIEEFRQMQADLSVAFSGDFPEGIETHDITIAGLGAKLHRRQDYNQETMPTLLYVAGGAFVSSGLNNDAPKRMVDDSQIIMLGHHLAPEVKIMQCVQDITKGIIDVLKRFEEFKIGKAIAVGGDSSGASFVLAAMIALRDTHPDVFKKINCMILISPAIDLTMSPSTMKEYDDQDALFSTDAVMAVQTWLSKENFKSPEVSPIYTLNFTGLPPVHVIVAECDRLRSHEVVLKEKCIAEGVEYSNHICAGQVHAFLNFRGPLNEGEDPAKLTADALQRCITTKKKR